MLDKLKNISSKISVNEIVKIFLIFLFLGLFVYVSISYIQLKKQTQKEINNISSQLDSTRKELTDYRIEVNNRKLKGISDTIDIINKELSGIYQDIKKYREEYNEDKRKFEQNIDTFRSNDSAAYMYLRRRYDSIW